MRFIGVDYGRKRVGIAVSDEEGNFALPHAVWPNDATLIDRIVALCSEKKAVGIVLGESKNLSGQNNEIMRDILMFKTALQKAISIPIYLEPEYFTSAEARRVQGETPMHDASAAALILKSYIDRKK